MAKKYLVVDIDLAAVHAVLGPAYWRKKPSPEPTLPRVYMEKREPGYDELSLSTD